MEIDPGRGPSQTILVRQTIVRRDLVDTACRKLALSLDEVSFVACTPLENGDRCLISLRPNGGREASSGARLVRVLALAAALAAGADATLWWWRQESAIATITAQAAAEREKALAVRGLEN